MEQVVPWRELCVLIEPHYPKPGNGRPPVGVERMLRMYFLQQWFNLSDPAVGPVRLAGDEAVRGDRFGAGTGARRNHAVQVSAFVRRTWTGEKILGTYMTGLTPPFDRNVHYLAVSSSAAYGYLKPNPASRLRRPTSISNTAPCSDIKHVHGTKFPGGTRTR
jgi:hypothetical protein